MVALFRRNSTAVYLVAAVAGVARLLCCAGLLLLPVLFFVGGYLVQFHLVLSALYALTAIAVLIETVCGISYQVPARGEKLPTCAMVVAYLPAEQHIIIDTLRHIYSTNAFDQVLLVYNTPKQLPIEERLRKLKWLDCVQVPNSHSKAENINHALDHNLVRCPVVAVFDADHRPAQTAPARASNWLRTGKYAAVQGQCVVINNGLLPSIVRAEFFHIYRFMHTSRFKVAGSGIFGGSNCYWRTADLQQYRLNTNRLTEDIDLSMRVIARGQKIAHDPSIVSYETAPTTLPELWKQRTRWSQGWTQVTLTQTSQLLHSPFVRPHQKLYWIYSMYYRELFNLVSLSSFLVLAAYPVLDQQGGLLHQLLTTSSTVIGIGCVCAIAAILRSYGSGVGVVRYLLGSMPYITFKAAVWNNGTARLITGNQRWEVTNKSQRGNG